MGCVTLHNAATFPAVVRAQHCACRRNGFVHAVMNSASNTTNHRGAPAQIVLLALALTTAIVALFANLAVAKADLHGDVQQLFLPSASSPQQPLWPPLRKIDNNLDFLAHAFAASLGPVSEGTAAYHQRKRKSRFVRASHLHRHVSGPHARLTHRSCMSSLQSVINAVRDGLLHDIETNPGPTFTDPQQQVFVGGGGGGGPAAVDIALNIVRQEDATTTQQQEQHAAGSVPEHYVCNPHAPIDTLQFIDDACKMENLRHLESNGGGPLTLHQFLDRHVDNLVAATIMKVSWVHRMATRLADPDLVEDNDDDGHSDDCDSQDDNQDVNLDEHSIPATEAFPALIIYNVLQRLMQSSAVTAMNFLKNLSEMNVELPLTIGAHKNCIKAVSKIIPRRSTTILVTGNAANQTTMLNAMYRTKFETYCNHQRQGFPTGFSQIALATDRCLPDNIIDCHGDLLSPESPLLSADAISALRIRKLVLCLSYPMSSADAESLQLLLSKARLTNLLLAFIIVVDKKKCTNVGSSEAMQDKYTQEPYNGVGVAVFKGISSTLPTPPNKSKFEKVFRAIHAGDASHLESNPARDQVSTLEAALANVFENSNEQVRSTVFRFSAARSSSGGATPRRPTQLHALVQLFFDQFEARLQQDEDVYELMETWIDAITGFVEPRTLKMKEDLVQLKKRIDNTEENTLTHQLETEYREKSDELERHELGIVHFVTELDAAADRASGALQKKYQRVVDTIQREHCQRGYGIELISGDMEHLNTRAKDYFPSNELDASPNVVAIFGPQSTGKSTVIRNMLDLKLATSATRCTRGINVAAAHVRDPNTGRSRPTLVLDSEGLFSMERGDRLFDKKVVNNLMSSCSTVIVNVKGQLLEDMKNYLDIFAYCVDQLQLPSLMPNLIIVLRDMTLPCDVPAQLRTIRRNLLDREIELNQSDGTTRTVTLAEMVSWKDENLVVLPPAFKEPEPSMGEWMDANAAELKLYQRKAYNESFVSGCVQLARLIVETPPHRYFSENVHCVGDWITLLQQRRMWVNENASFLDLETLEDVNQNTQVNVALSELRFGVVGGDSAIAVFTENVRRAFTAAAANGINDVDLSECNLGPHFTGRAFRFPASCRTLRDRFEHITNATLSVPDAVPAGDLDCVGLDTHSIAFGMLRQAMRNVLLPLDNVKPSRLHNAEEQGYATLRDQNKSLSIHVLDAIKAMETRSWIEQRSQAKFNQLLSRLSSAANGARVSPQALVDEFETVIDNLVRNSEGVQPSKDAYRRRILKDANHLDKFKWVNYDAMLSSEGFMRQFVNVIRDSQPVGGEEFVFHNDPTIVRLVENLNDADITTFGMQFLAQRMLSALATTLRSPILHTDPSSVIKNLQKHLQAQSWAERRSKQWRTEHYIALHQLCLAAVLFVRLETEFGDAKKKYDAAMESVRQEGRDRLDEFRRTCQLVANHSPQDVINTIRDEVIKYHVEQHRRNAEAEIGTAQPEEIITNIVRDLLNDLLLRPAGDSFDDFFNYVVDPNGTIENYYVDKVGDARARRILGAACQNAIHDCRATLQSIATAAERMSFDDRRNDSSVDLVRAMLPATNARWRNIVGRMLETTCGSSTAIASVCGEIKAKFAAPTVSITATTIIPAATLKTLLLEHFKAKIRGGCRNHCPYCRTICTADHATNPDAKCESILHLFDGMGGWRSALTGVLQRSNCSCKSDGRYLHEGQYYPMNEHLRLANPNWIINRSPQEFNIDIADDFHKALVRAYVKLNERLADHFNAKPAEFPSSWTNL